MSADDTAERERLLGVLRERAGKVPPKVLAGGLKSTQAYKEAMKKVNTLLAAKRTPSLLQLQGAVGQLNPYF